MGEQKKLVRPIEGGKVGGVCAAFANYFDIDVTLVRVVCALGIFFTCLTGVLVYIIMMIVIPKAEY